MPRRPLPLRSGTGFAVDFVGESVVEREIAAQSKSRMCIGVVAWSLLSIPGRPGFLTKHFEPQLAVDLGGSPIRVLLGQALDQSANLLGNLRSAAAWPGSPAPIETEAGAVPAYHGVGFHENQDARPAGPTLAECRPEKPIPGVQFWPRPFPFQHGDLLSEGEDFERGIASTAKEGSDGHKEREEDVQHEFILLTRRNVASHG